MFSKSKSAPGGASASMAAANGTFSVIGSDVVITGNVGATADLHLDGAVEGDIACASLVQGEESRIRGNVTAQTARLSGTLEGSIHARELVVERTARITGDVTYETISIASGASVEGRFTRRGGAVLTGESESQLKLVSGSGE